MSKAVKKYARNLLVTLLIIAVAFVISIPLQRVLDISEHITTLFAFAVFIVSFVTGDFLCGIISTLASTLLINYAFTYPYYDIDFSVPENIFSAIVMLIISFLTSAFTTKLKAWRALKEEGERERMRANLLRAVSHDLRTPLTTIYGASSSIIENHEKLKDDQKMQMIVGIREDSEWLIRMVENLLSVTKINDGRVKIVKTPTVLWELVDTVIQKFKKRYPDVKVELDLPEETVLIPMDAILIGQVMVNILENAVHHAAGMKRLALSVSIKDTDAVFEIADDGCGIDESKLDTIFSGISQSEVGSQDAKKRNAGIGLSVCASIVRAHGGRISAENLPGGGAMFRFILSTEEAKNE